ncbi:MAG: Dabb family protein [Gammaproteobacteria bacterium]
MVVWLKEPGNATHRQTILDASDILRTIPGVRTLKSGTVIASERAIVDSSFDVALIVSFTNQADMDAYLVHPLHVKLVNETLKPLVAKIRVFDFQ